MKALLRQAWHGRMRLSALRSLLRRKPALVWVGVWGLLSVPVLWLLASSGQGRQASVGQQPVAANARRQEDAGRASFGHVAPALFAADDSAQAITPTSGTRSVPMAERGFAARGELVPVRADAISVSKPHEYPVRLSSWDVALPDPPQSDFLDPPDPDDFYAALQAPDADADIEMETVRPPVLRPPGLPPVMQPTEMFADLPPYLVMPLDPPLGFSGRSSVRPREPLQSSHFVPLEDRWRVGFPEWDRYNRGHPRTDDYPFVEGNVLNPYKQNVLKGDYPIIGQHTFLNVTISDLFLVEARQVPTPATGFQVGQDPGDFETFGNPNQFFLNNNTALSFDLSHGDAGFKPADWRLRITPEINENYLAVQERGVVNVDVNQGTTRFRSFVALQEWFAEAKLADLSADYDFISARLGSQKFVSDFRGFIFVDTNRAARLFGTRLANRDEFNIIFFEQLEKDTNSELNTLEKRHQQILIANYYRQDFIFPGYTAQLSFHWNHDQPSMHFDKNGFLVRPDAAGAFQKHTVDAFYFGWAGDGHINRLNISHAFYQVFGHDSLNPLAGQPVTISAQMAAVELSYDRDWARFRTSLFFASGQHDANGSVATGFDTIMDNPNFAGGSFSFWQRQAIKLQGVNLKQRFSLVPDLRSSKTEGQSNFYNPGLVLLNAGVDFDVTPKLRIVNNLNFLWFESTSVLRQFLFQNQVRNFIGTDLSSGVEYRPLLNNNIIFTGGVSGLVPGSGFQDIYNPSVGRVNNMFAGFMEMTLLF